MYELGPFRLNPHAGVLTRDDRPVPLGARAVAVLTTLVEHPREHVPKQRILEAAWPGVVVEESNLAVQISAIRRALADFPGGEAWVETLARRGYRFVGPVRRVDAEAAAARRPAMTTGSAFIGRESDLQAARALLEDHRLLTVVGTGGIGKTRLAQRLAEIESGRYLDGVWFVDLAPVIGDERVAAAVAEALHVPLPTGKPPFDAIRNRLRDRNVLLVLDNCEHLLEGCARLAADLLRDTPHPSILATSREALRVGGEQVYPLSPLGLPAAGMALDEILRTDSVRLFVQRAREQLPGLELSEARAHLVASLCTHLDGIPLALELAAARVRTLSIEQIHARLDDRFRLLTAGARDTQARHQTLRAAMDWSFDLLDEDERAVLRRSAVFAGGFTLEAVAAVASCEQFDEHAVTDLFLQLVSRSLVVAETREATGRYRLLETTRAFALEKLREAGELAAIQRRHAEYFCRLFERAPDDYIRRPDAYLRSVYLAEIENVRAALDWATGPGNAPQLAIALASRTSWIWTVPVLFSEGLARLGAAAALVDAGTPALDEAELLFAIGLLHSGKPAKQIEPSGRAVELFRRLGHTRGLAIALSRHSRVHAQSGRFEEAQRLLDEALPLVEADGGQKLLGAYHSEVGFLRQMTGDNAAASGHYEIALRHFREAGAVNVANQLVSTLADIRWALGDLEGAIQAAKDAAVVWRKGPWRTVFGYDVINLAGMYVERGDLDLALATAAEPDGLVFARDRGVLWMFLDNFALLAARRGKLETAARLAGFAEHGHRANECLRQANEARAQKRVLDLLRSSFPPDKLAALMAEGALLEPEDACRLALGSDH
jgi:predicted ATPase/DNA-binding winged helix-turn-helix (wHTH) protein